ncbi:MAG TPA: FAD-dependent oxidoreductase [Solirubrobacteraceae bacterium]
MAAREEEVDVLVVGSGGGGLAASIRARAAGLDTLVVEKDRVVGGTTALSHGGIWLPANPLMLEAGLHDSVEDGLTYMQAVVGDQGPATSPARQAAFIRGGQRLIRFLRDEGVPFRLVSEYPDYYPESPGGRNDGRMLSTPLLDARRLGAWHDLPRSRPPLPAGVVMSSVEQFIALLNIGRSRKAKLDVAKIFASSITLRLRGIKPLVMGQSYVGHLLAAAQRRGVRIATGTRMRELVVEDGRVVGIRAERNGETLTIRSRHGVVLAAGGFARNRALRDKFGPQPASADWTAVIQGDTGDPFLAATAIGAATSNLDKAYWLPGLMDERGVAQIFIAERVAPHSILVDSSGARFTNEAKSYVELGNDQYARNETVPAIPAYLVVDAQHRRRTPLGQVLPGMTPRAWLKSGHLKRAGTLRELAESCGIDPHGLERTVARFNQLARAGVDEDFGRGDSAYDRVYGDPDHGPNTCLGAIEEAPFYAAKMYPTDVGMAGGLLTDERAQVLAEDGPPIEGLYACGTSAASCAGDVYPGGGASLAQSSAFGFIAAEQMAAHAATRIPSDTAGVTIETRG